MTSISTPETRATRCTDFKRPDPEMVKLGLALLGQPGKHYFSLFEFSFNNRLFNEPDPIESFQDYVLTYDDESDPELSTLNHHNFKLFPNPVFSGINPESTDPANFQSYSFIPITLDTSSTYIEAQEILLEAASKVTAFFCGQLGFPQPVLIQQQSGGIDPGTSTIWILWRADLPNDNSTRAVMNDLSTGVCKKFRYYDRGYTVDTGLIKVIDWKISIPGTYSESWRLKPDIFNFSPRMVSIVQHPDPAEYHKTIVSLEQLQEAVDKIDSLPDFVDPFEKKPRNTSPVNYQTYFQESGTSETDKKLDQVIQLQLNQIQLTQLQLADKTIGNKSKNSQTNLQPIKPEFKDWLAIEATPDNGNSWVIEGFLSKGLNILAGKPKVRKSWLALYWAICVATGKETLAGVKPEAGNVLYLALEDNDERLRDRIKKIRPALKIDQPAPDVLTFCTKFPMQNEGGLDAIQEWIHSVDKPTLIIIDTLGKFRTPSKPGANVYQDDVLALSQIKDLADTNHIGILVVHHVKKQETDDPLDQISGSNGIIGTCDTGLVLSKKRDEEVGKLFVTGRDVEEDGFIPLKFDRKTCVWSTDQDRSKEEPGGEVEIRIVKLFQTTPSARLNPKDVAIALSLDEKQVRTTMDRLWKKGFLSRTPKGVSPIFFFLPVPHNTTEGNSKDEDPGCMTTEAF